MPSFRQLRRTHPDLDLDRVRLHSDLFAGGQQFHRNIERYLLRNEAEPSSVYKRRCERAFYIGYVAPIIQYFASFLFSSPLEFNSDPEPDLFYGDFKENVDKRGTKNGTDLDQFLRHAFVDACKHRSAFIRIDFPEPGSVPVASVAEWQSAGMGQATLAHVHVDKIRNWLRGPDLEWMWVLEYDCREELLEVTDEQVTTTETFTLWRAGGAHQRWQAVYPKGKPPSPEDQVPEVDAPDTPIGGIPIVEMKLPQELYVMDLMADGQLEHFRKSNALSHAIDRTCFAMLWAKLKDQRKLPRIGSDYYGILGIDEEIGYVAPPDAPFTMIQDYASKLKDELHRVSHQMAMGVENNAAAIGRSGQSKLADNTATEIVLGAFGRVVREAVEKLLDLISRGRGEDLNWSVGGMDNYRIPDAEHIVATALTSDQLQIPSVTFRKEMFTKVAFAILPEADEPTKQAIRDEIEAGVHPEDSQILHDEKIARATASIKQAETGGQEQPGGFDG